MFANLRLKNLFFFIIFLGVSFSSPSWAQKRILPIESWTLPTGARVFYVYAPEIPMVDIQVIFDAGSARDNMKPGLAQITNEMLATGTKKRNSDEIAAAFDNVGAIYANSVNRDMAIVALRSLSDPKFLDPALDAYIEVLSQPNFSSSEFKRIQKQTLNVINQQDEQPALIAAKAFYNKIYDDYPYGHPVMGTAASIQKLATHDLQKFYQQYYVGKNAIMVIVGSLPSDQARLVSQKIIASLASGDSAPAITSSIPAQNKSLEHISFPSAQTHVLIGQLGIKKMDPAYYSTTVGNYILGGGALTSRLFDQVREKRGLAYSVYSRFVALKERGPFIVELQTRNQEVKNAVAVVNNTFNDFITKGPTDNELILAKKNITQGFILKLASNSAVVSNLANMGFYRLPLDFLDTYKDKINAVTRLDIQNTFKDLFSSQNLLTVTVGNEH